MNSRDTRTPHLSRVGVCQLPRGTRIRTALRDNLKMQLVASTRATSEALSKPHRTYATSDEREDSEIRLLGLALKDQIKKELLSNQNFPNPQ